MRHLSAFDRTILAISCLVGFGIGAVARRSIKTGLDFFLSARRLPAWVIVLRSVAASLGAFEILGMAATARVRRGDRALLLDRRRLPRQVWCCERAEA
jgi:hypothetical protein